ncbi:hypothetical protein [Desulfovibrio sp. ZJ746]|uniref:hypothetical protein n=1 Tax=Desulfovibrio sp. ZJ746 TaxID=2709795 RepID=UPI001F14E8FA|nr:hypothetical protein [Desulfovibrio sp. ZJ746]
MHTIHGDMDVIISRIAMQTVDGLMVFQAHLFQKNIHKFINLGARVMLAFGPGKYPVIDRHFAPDGLPRQSDHFQLLRRMSVGYEIAIPGVFDLFPAISH